MQSFPLVSKHYLLPAHIVNVVLLLLCRFKANSNKRLNVIIISWSDICYYSSLYQKEDNVSVIFVSKEFQWI